MKYKVAFFILCIMIYIMLKINLSEKELEELIKIRKSNKHSIIGERCLYIILLNEGLSCPNIALRLNRNIKAILKWVKRYKLKGVEGFKNIKQSGRPNIKGKIVDKVIKEILHKHPPDFGYVEEGWTSVLIQDYIEKTYKIRIGVTTIKNMLKKNNWVYKRFSKKVSNRAKSKEEKLLLVNEIVKEGLSELSKKK